MKSFIAKYHPREAWIINIDFKATEKINSTKIKFLPFWELIIKYTQPESSHYLEI